MSSETVEPAATAQQDESDLQKVRNGDSSGFDGLVERHYRAAYGVALACLHDPEAAEEAAQEAFLRAYLSLDKLRDGAAFVGWLVSIARNSAIDWSKRAQRRSRLLPMIPIEELIMEPPDSRNRSPREHLEEEQVAALVRQAVLRLPDPLREVVVLHYAEELTKSQIAEALGLHPSTVARQIDRALEELRSNVEPQLTASLKPLRSRPAATRVTTALLAGALALPAASKAALITAANGIPLPLPAADGVPTISSLPESASAASSPPQGISAKLLAGGGIRLLLLALIAAMAAPVLYRTLRPSPTAATTGSAAPAPARVLSAGTGSRAPKAPVTSSVSSRAPRRSTGAAAPLTSGPRLLVTGQVLRPDGTPATTAQVGLLRFNDPANPYEMILTPAADALADGDGRYRIEAEDALHFTLFAREKGSAPAWAFLHDQQARQRGPRAEGDRNIQHDLKLLPAATLAGRVGDESGQAVAGVRILAAPPMKGMAAPPALVSTSDEQGQFRFADLPAGNVIVAAESPRHAPLRKALDAPSEDVTLTLDSEGARVSGRVLLKEGAVPLSGATVALHRAENPPHFPQSWQTATSDESGRYTLDRLAGGKYLVKCHKGAYKMPPPGKPEGFLIQIDEGSTTDGFDLFLYPGHTVSGVVRNRQRGTPVEGAVVKFDGVEPVQAVTDSDGRYEARGVGTDSGNGVDYSVTASGYRLHHKEPHLSRTWVDLFSADSGEIKLDLELERDLVIRGNVRDEMGRPIAKAKVLVHTGQAVSPADEVTSTGSDGKYELTVSPRDQFHLKAYAPGRPVVFSTLLRPGNIPLERVDFVAGPGATLRAAVVDEKGAPVPGAQVRIELELAAGRVSLDEQILYERTGENGVLEAKGLPLLPLSISAEKDGYADSGVNTVTPSAVSGPLNDVTLILRQALELSGRVTGADGKPLKGVLVYAQSGETQPQSRTDADGRYRLKPLPAGHVTVHLSYQSGSTNLSDQIDRVQVGRTDADFVLKEKETVHVTGRVVDWKSQQPISDFQIDDIGGNRIEKDATQSGVFHLHALPGFTYFLQVKSPGYAPADVEILIPTDRSELERRIPLGPGGIVTGRVVDSGSRPLANVKVAVAAQYDVLRGEVTRPLASAESGPDGQFRLENVPDGRRSLFLTASSDERKKTASATVRPGETTDLGDITLGNGAVLSGRVVQMPGSIGIPGAPVELIPPGVAAPRSAVTDNGGGFLFESLPAGSYTLRSSKVPDEIKIELSGDERRQVLMRTGEATLEGTLTRCGKPVGGTLHLNRDLNGQGSGRTVTVRADGHFRVENLYPGAWELRAVSSGEAGWTVRDVEVRPGSNEIEVNIRCSPVKIMVQNPDGSPAAGVSVSVLNLRDFRKYSGFIMTEPLGDTGADGIFNAPLLSGEYSITATRETDGATAHIDRVEIADNDPEPAVTLRLTRAGGTLISVTRDPDGIPIGRIRCRIHGEHGLFLHNATRDADGMLLIPAIPPGKYRVEIGQWSGAIVHDVEIRDGETVTLEDTIGPMGVLRWILTDENGDPAADVPVQVTRTGAPDSEAATPRQIRTSPTGLAFLELPEGTYSATATPPGSPPITMAITIDQYVNDTVRSTVR